MDKNKKLFSILSDRRFLIAILFLMATIGAYFLDERVYAFVQTLQHGRGFVHKFGGLTDWGKGGYYIKASAILWLIFLFLSLFVAKGWIDKTGQFFLNCFLTLLFCGGLVNLLKIIVGRIRPYASQLEGHPLLAFEPLNFHHHFQSFPSGHSQVVFTVTFLVGYKVPWLRWPLLIFALAISSTRVIRNAHFLSDVVGGVLVAWVGYHLAQWILEKYELPRRINFRLLRLFRKA